MKKEIYSKILYIICALLIAGFAMTLWVKYKTYQMFALPFYYHVIFYSIVFLVPCLILLLIARVLKRMLK
ncbi:Uncharacterised protein [uncultured Eubacterium sp.]|nr:Uncharacterised protein [uncultured Eubacterium sp.]